MGRGRVAVGRARPCPEHDEHHPGPGPRRDGGGPVGRRDHRPARRERPRAHGRHRRDGALHARRAAGRDLRRARHARPVPPALAAGDPPRGGRARGAQPDPRPGWGRGRDHRHAGDRGAAHALRRARLPRLRADDPRPSPERPQLHRPRLPAARRRRLPLPRGRLGGRPRPRGERQRPGPALERVPARRHADERLHEQPGRAARPAPRSARRPCASSAWRRTPTAPSSGAARAGRST